MSPLSNQVSDSIAPLAAGSAAGPKFRLFDFVMAPFRDVDGRVDRNQHARRLANIEAKKREAAR
jgi:hypothetical protein